METEASSGDDIEASSGDEPGPDDGAGTDSGGRPRRARRGAVAVAVVVVLGLVGAVVWALAGGDEAEPAADEAGPATATTSSTVPPEAQPVVPASALVATSQVAEIQVFDAPDDAAEPVTSLSDTTDFGASRTFLVVQEQGSWLEVLLPIRPNGTTGWIRAGDVATATTTYAVGVDLGAHKVTLYEAGEPVVETDAVVGASETPTPVGTFYVTDPVDLRAEPDGAYGAFALGLSGFSEVLYEFAGGPGQLALHGTNRPDQLGQDLSNGCVRVPNEVILQLAERLPLGTPVHITA